MVPDAEQPAPDTAPAPLPHRRHQHRAVALGVALVVVLGAAGGTGVWLARSSDRSFTASTIPIPTAAEPSTNLPACYQSDDVWLMSLCGGDMDMPKALAVMGNGIVVVGGATLSQNGSFADAPAAYAGFSTPFTAQITRPTDMSLTFGGLAMNDAAPMADGGIVAVGHEYVLISPDDSQKSSVSLNAKVIRYDQDLNVVWQATYITSNRMATFTAVAVGLDGSIVAVGTNTATSHGLDQAMMAKYSATGDQLWAHDLGEIGKDFPGTPNSLAIDSAGNIYIVATTSKPSEYTASGTVAGAAIAMANPSGDIVWTKTYGGTGKDVFNDAVTTPDGIMVVGASYSKDGDFAQPEGSAAIMAVINQTGDIVTSCFYSDVISATFNSVAMTARGDFALAGQTSRSGFSDDALITLVQPPTGLGGVCHATWSLVYDGDSDDEFTHIAMSPDGEIVVTGQTASGLQSTLPTSMGGYDVVVAKLTLRGILA